MSQEPPPAPTSPPHQELSSSRIPHSQIGILGFCFLWFVTGLGNLIRGLTGKEMGEFVFAIATLLFLAGLPFLFYGIWRRLRKNPPAKYLWLTLLNALLFVGGIGLTMVPMFRGAIDADLNVDDGDGSEKAAAAKQIVTADGGYRIAVPGDWEARPEYDSDVQVIWSNSHGDQWLSFGSVPKQDLVDPTLETHLLAIVDTARSSATNVEIIGHRTSQSSGFSSMDLTVTAEEGNLRLTYLLFAIDTPNYIVDLRFWTTQSQFETCLATFEQIANTLEPVEGDLRQ